MSGHVAVLMGGWSTERDVSLVSGACVAEALRDAGYEVSTIDIDRDVDRTLAKLSPRPIAVFNALHGRYGEDGCIQGLLNILALPYTHSGLLASAVAMDKPIAKSLFAAAGIPVAEHIIVTKSDVMAGDVMDRPYVIKPINEGSSVGVRIVRPGDNFILENGDGWPFGNQVMVERFIPGRELTVAVMGDRPLAVTEIATDRDFYDYESKYSTGGSVHSLPAAVDPPVYDRAMEIGLAAHHVLGCRGVSRADIRYDGKDTYLLEVNTQPGMTPTSLVPEQAAHVDISFKALVTWMVENAACDS